MADVMWSAVTADSQPTDTTESIARLQLENATLRELLSAGRHSLVSPVCSQGVQTDISLSDDDDVSTSMSSCGEANSVSVVSSPPHAAPGVILTSPPVASNTSDVDVTEQ